jgi:O-antigen/teichoic acid export membrane protein
VVGRYSCQEMPTKWLARATAALPLIDQGLISAGNFASGVVVARAVDQSAFSAWVLANMVVWAAVPLQGGLVLQPLVVNGGGLDRDQFGRYLRANLPLQLAFLLAATGVVGAVAVLWEPLRPVALPVTLAAAALLAQDFCRRVLYARDRMAAALASNVINYDLQAAVLAAVWLWRGLDASTALWIVASSSAASLVVALFALRGLVGEAGGDVRRVTTQNLRLGGWGLASESFHLVSFHFFPALLFTLAGEAIAAGYGAIWLLLGVFSLLARPIRNYFLPRATDAWARNGIPGLRRVIVRVAWTIGPPYGLAALLLTLFPSQALAIVYGGRLTEFGPGLAVFAVGVLLYLPFEALSLALHVRRQQRALFYGQVAQTVGLYAAALLLVPSHGLVGAGIAYGLARLLELAVAVLAVRSLGPATDGATDGASPPDRARSFVQATPRPRTK